MRYPKPTDLEMTKHSDYFVRKDTSERVARRCDYTVDKKRVIVVYLNTVFGGSWATKNTAKKNPEMHSPTRY